MREPTIIQAGMGIGISSWQLAKTVAQMGQMGVVSGTGLDTVLVRRLQLGDEGGHLKRAMAKFPFQEVVSRVLNRYFKPNGLSKSEPFGYAQMTSAQLSKTHQELLVLANFVEVFLAKEGHEGKVGVNYLEKVQMPILPSLYGAMLAGVDYVLMGAGIPKDIPKVLDLLALNADVDYKLSVQKSEPGDDYRIRFSPRDIFGEGLPQLNRPKFLAVISSAVLALTLARKASGRVDGFVIEAPSAGGHNAPPRGKAQFNERGEPLYGERDEVDFNAIAELGLPFWLAGSRGSANGLKSALALGAAGVQVGTAFALCRESGLSPSLKESILQKVSSGNLDVFTDPLASPTGFPFKVLNLKNTNAQSDIYSKRVRRCDLGYLRQPYKKDDETLEYRCAAEPVTSYVKKGGREEDTRGRKCLCNGLLANIDLGQRLDSSEEELPLVTIGDDIHNIGQFLTDGTFIYSARDVINKIAGQMNSKELTSEIKK